MIKHVAIWLCLVWCFTAHGQIITTFAGSGGVGVGGGGFSGDGGPATAAQFIFTSGAAIDTNGNVYIGDQNNHRVRKVNAAGIISTFAGNGTPGYTGDGGPATAAELGLIGGMCTDRYGNIYIADLNDFCVRKVDAAGIITTLAGTGVMGYNGDGIVATAAQLVQPNDVVADTNGNVYIADASGYRVRKVDKFGIITTLAGNGIMGSTGDGSPATASEVTACGIGMDKAGNIYLAQSYYANVRMINTGGIISTIAGNGIRGDSGDGGPATAAELYEPADVAIDAAGNWYITDQGNGRIRKVDAAGHISTLAGKGGSGVVCGFSGDGWLADSAQICGASGIAVSESGNVYFADRQNNRVRVINYQPFFARGHTGSITVCNAVTSIDTLLPVVDSDLNPTEIWSIVYGATHGTAAAAGTMTAPGDTIKPAGLSYAPAAGYTGPDSFRVRVTDGLASDTITIYVTVNQVISTGTITGIDSVCPGKTVVLSDTAAGGVWISTHTGIAGVGVSGLVTGISTGMDTITYTITVAGCSASAMLPFKVLSEAVCTEGISPSQSLPRKLTMTIDPNPGNGGFMINVQSDRSEDARVVICNVMGQKVQEFMLSTNKQKYVELKQPAGVYFAHVVTAEGSMVAEVELVQ